MPFRHINLDHLPDEDLRGIGLVAEAWAYLEGAIERICWLVAGIDTERNGQAFTTHATVRSRVDAMCALVRENFPESPAAADLPALGNKIAMELSGKRNDIVHSRLHRLPDIPQTLRTVYKARGKIKKETIPVDPAEYGRVTREILDVANQLIDHLNDLIELVKQRDGAAPPWC